MEEIYRARGPGHGASTPFLGVSPHTLVWSPTWKAATCVEPHSFPACLPAWGSAVSGSPSGLSVSQWVTCPMFTCEGRPTALIHGPYILLTQPVTMITFNSPSHRSFGTVALLMMIWSWGCSYVAALLPPGPLVLPWVLCVRP